ncbi:MAG TPA: thioesterase family protein [Paraburkholderia sp.]|jgi:acyl-CoA thioester hydrolase|nr:thioesterase family protein [Paraburkholderia sp.]
MSNEREARRQRADFTAWRTITTRWSDNDIYGHVNNVVYYSYFDTAVNVWLIEADLLALAGSEPAATEPIGLVVETQCRYFAPLAFPDEVSVGIRVAHIGTSSVKYELAVFRNDDQAAAAQGHFVHVYVDRTTRRPAALRPEWRQRLAQLQTEPQTF